MEPFASHRPGRSLVKIDADGDPIPGVPAVVQVIAAVGENDIDVIILVPVVVPVLRPRIHEPEPESAVLEAWISAIEFHGIPMDAEPVIPAKMGTISVVGNTVAIVAATLLPVAVLGLPVVRAMLLPHLALLPPLHRLTSLHIRLLLPVPVLLLDVLFLLLVPVRLLGVLLLLLAPVLFLSVLILLALNLLLRMLSLLLVILLLVRLCVRGSGDPEKKRQHRADNRLCFHKRLDFQPFPVALARLARVIRLLCVFISTGERVRYRWEHASKRKRSASDRQAQPVLLSPVIELLLETKSLTTRTMAGTAPGLLCDDHF
jgi:hypothetical protein